MPVTSFTVPFNDTFFYLAASYSPGAGILAMQDLSALPGGIPSSTSPIRLSIARARDGAKTIVKCTGKAGNNLTGVTVIEGKTDIPLDAGDLAKVQISAGYISDIHTAVNALEGTTAPSDFGPSGPSHSHGLVPDPGATSGTAKFLREDATWVNVPIPSDFTNTTHGLVPVPSPSGGSSKFLREDASWQVPPTPSDFTNTVHGLVPVPSPSGGSSKFLREDATWVAPAPGMEIGNTVTSGTAGRVLYEGTGPVLADSNRLKFDDSGSNAKLQVGARLSDLYPCHGQVEIICAGTESLSTTGLRLTAEGYGHSIIFQNNAGNLYLTDHTGAAYPLSVFEYKNPFDNTTLSLSTSQWSWNPGGLNFGPHEHFGFNYSSYNNATFTIGVPSGGESYPGVVVVLSTTPLNDVQQWVGPSGAIKVAIDKDWGLTFYNRSSTNNDRVTGAVRSAYSNSTDASFTGTISLVSYDYAGAREGVRVEADGSAARIGFLGQTAAVRQTGGSATASGTYGSTEQTMLQKAYDALRTFGLLS